MSVLLGRVTSSSAHVPGQPVNSESSLSLLWKANVVQDLRSGLAGLSGMLEYPKLALRLEFEIVLHITHFCPENFNAGMSKMLLLLYR